MKEHKHIQRQYEQLRGGNRALIDQLKKQLEKPSMDNLTVEPLIGENTKEGTKVSAGVTE